MQQLLTESTLLALAGGICGVVIAVLDEGSRCGWFIPPAPLPIEMDPTIGVPVLLFAVGVTGASVLVFGLVPALQGSSSIVSGAEGIGWQRDRVAAARAHPSGAGRRAGRAVAHAAGVGRAVRHARCRTRSRSIRASRRAAGVLASIDLLPAGYDAARGRVFLRDLLARVREAAGRRRRDASRRACRSASAGSATWARPSTATRRRRTKR